MAMNRIQFQPGLSLPVFHAQFGTEKQCSDVLGGCPIIQPIMIEWSPTLK